MIPDIQGHRHSSMCYQFAYSMRCAALYLLSSAHLFQAAEAVEDGDCEVGRSEGCVVIADKGRRPQLRAWVRAGYGEYAIDRKDRLSRRGIALAAVSTFSNGAQDSSADKPSSITCRLAVS